VKPQTLEQATAGNGNFVLYGPSGSGKTASLATLDPGNTEIIATEDGLRTLKDMSLDYPELNKLTVYNANTMAEAQQAYEAVAVSGKKYLAIDSLTKLGDICLAQEMVATANDARRAYPAMASKMTNIIDLFNNLDKTVIFISQEELVNDDAFGRFDYKYAPSIPGKKFAAKTAYFFDFIFVMRTRVAEDESIERKFQTDLHGGDYLAKSRSTRLMVFEDPNWMDIFNKTANNTKEVTND